MPTEAQKKLRNRVKELELLQELQKEEFKRVIKNVGQELKPIALFRNFLHDVVNDNKQIKSNLFSVFSSLATTIISNSIIGKNRRLRTRLLTSIGKFGVDKLVYNYSDNFRKYYNAILEVAKDSFSKMK